jgi:hypothetical protein
MPLCAAASRLVQTSATSSHVRVAAMRAWGLRGRTCASSARVRADANLPQIWVDGSGRTRWSGCIAPLGRAQVTRPFGRTRSDTCGCRCVVPLEMPLEHLHSPPPKPQTPFKNSFCPAWATSPSGVPRPRPIHRVASGGADARRKAGGPQLSVRHSEISLLFHLI